MTAAAARQPRPEPPPEIPAGLRPFAERSAGELDAVVARMKRVERFFKDTLGIDLYLTWGTLLGAMRAGDFIPHDTDVDIAYASPMTTDHEIVDEHDVIRRVLYDRDMIVSLDSKGQIHIAAEDGAATRPQDAGTLDLWTTFVRDGRYFHYPDIQGDLPADALYPLRPIALRGVEFLAPNRAEDVLAAFYGPDWRVPDPGYVWYSTRDQADPFEFLRHERRAVTLPDKPRRVHGLDISEDGEIFVVRVPGRETPVRLNATALLILELCTGSHGVARIVELVRRAYRLDASPEAVVTQFLTEAVDEGLIA